MLLLCILKIVHFFILYCVSFNQKSKSIESVKLISFLFYTYEKIVFITSLFSKKKKKLNTPLIMTVRFEYSTQTGFALFDFIYDFLPLKNNIIVLTNSNSDQNKFSSTMTTIPSWRIVFQGKSMAHKSKHDMVKAAEARRIKSNTHVSPTLFDDTRICVIQLRCVFVSISCCS